MFKGKEDALIGPKVWCVIVKSAGLNITKVVHVTMGSNIYHAIQTLHAVCYDGVKEKMYWCGIVSP